MTGLSEAWLVSFFIAGLQEQLKCELLLAQPTTYYQTVSLAKLHEQKLANLQSTLKPNMSKSNSLFMPRAAGMGSTYLAPTSKTAVQNS